MTIEPIGSYRATWGEGPIWWDGMLLYVDIEQHKVIGLNPTTGEEKVIEVGERVGTVVPRETGGLLIAGDNGLYFLNCDGEKTAIADPEPDKLVTAGFPAPSGRQRYLTRRAEEENHPDC